MVFERLRQQMAAKDIARQQREQAEQEAKRVAEQQKAEAQRQRDEITKAENDRISAERQKALTFRQQSGILDKIREFRELVEKSSDNDESGSGWLHFEKYGPYRLYSQLEEDDHNWRSTPSSVADRIIWNHRLVSRRLPKEDHVAGNYMIRVTEVVCTENYLIAETFPDGTICIRGSKLAAIFGIGNKRLTRADWNQEGVSRPDVFEEPIYNAYQNPSTRNYTYKETKEEYRDSGD